MKRSRPLIITTLLGFTVAAAQTSSPASPTAASKPALDPAGPSRPLAKAFAEASWVRRPTRQVALEAYKPAAEIDFRMYTEPRPLRVWITKIDLSHPQVKLVTTQPTEFTGEDAKFETSCVNTLEFAQRADVQLAINTSAFGPFRPRSGMPMDVVGLGAYEGEVFSPPDERFGALYISKDGRVSLKGPNAELNGVWNAAGGFRMLLDDGELVVAEDVANSAFGQLNPRTAVGVDRDGQHLWIVVADGRQPDVSMGLTLVELAALFRSLGAYDALNLDGGGSSTFVLQNADREHEVFNIPVGRKIPDSLRQVGANLGIRLPGPRPEAGLGRHLNGRPALHD